MRQIVFLLIFIGFLMPIHSQFFSADELLNKAIEYHDPNSFWNDFKASFYVTMESIKRPLRTSKITLDLKQSFFNLSVGEHDWTFLLVGRSLYDGNLPFIESWNMTGPVAFIFYAIPFVINISSKAFKKND